MFKYFIKTFGCQMNFSDSERLANFLNSMGFKPLKIKIQKEIIAQDLVKADLVIFNSCGVRKMAEDRAFGQIHNLRKKNPKIKIALTGCIAQRKDVQKVLKDKVDLFFSIKDFNLLQNFVIENFLDNNLKNQNSKLEIQNYTTNKEFIDYLSINPKYTNKFSANIPIMTGCNNFCAYCVVPYARGREVSRPAEEIINEIKFLIKKGYREIILLGQNVNSYKSEIRNSKFEKKPKSVNSKTKNINFSKLLKMINDIPGDFWIRFMSPHPKDMNDELIEAVTQLDKVCESVHLPIQSGDNKVLQNMNRRYTRKHYLGLINKIKNSFTKNKPGRIFSLSSDVIVGFPGETKTQLEKTAKVMRKVEYDMVYFGQFSPRPQTAAWKMKDNVKKEEKEGREKYLNEILAQTTFANNKKYLNQIFDVLIESQKDGAYFGKTRTLKNVMIKTDDCHPAFITGSKNLVGKIVPVKITKVNVWNLEGKIYEK